jgi:hypothetical protein
MEYRGVQYTITDDDRGWQWTVLLGNPEKVHSGHELSKMTAILKVWAAIDRKLANFRPAPSGPLKT